MRTKRRPATGDRGPQVVSAKKTTATFTESPRPNQILAFHPLANVFPLLEGAEFDGLVADIKAHSLREPIALFKGKILDGRNRYRACREAGVDPRYEQFEGDYAAAAAFVVSKNLVRRHQGPSERALTAAKLASFNHGGDRSSGKFAACVTQADAAALVAVSERMVRGARLVLDQGVPELVQAVERGRLAVHEAEKVARHDAEAQQEFLESGRDYIVWRTDRLRKDKAETLAQTSRALPVGEKRWSVILADPAWLHDPGTQIPSREITANHYACQPLEEICAMPVGDLATDDAILFLWTTSPHLEKAFQVIAAWGFTYKTGLRWDKMVAGTGYFLRGEHEHLLLAVRGNPPKPPYEAVPGSMIRERKREHSRKPEAAYALIERMYPDLPKIELFARHARPGWACWGAEVPPPCTEQPPAAISSKGRAR